MGKTTSTQHITSWDGLYVPGSTQHITTSTQMNELNEPSQEVQIIIEIVIHSIELLFMFSNLLFHTLSPEDFEIGEVVD